MKTSKAIPVFALITIAILGCARHVAVLHLNGHASSDTHCAELFITADSVYVSDGGATYDTVCNGDPLCDFK
jgi:hypothetical protein